MHFKDTLLFAATENMRQDAEKIFFVLLSPASISQIWWRHHTKAV